jgi:hypothetical protein
VTVAASTDRFCHSLCFFGKVIDVRLVEKNSLLCNPEVCMIIII